MEYVRWLPKKVMSRWVGHATRSRVPVLAEAARDWFVKRYQINMAEAEKPLSEYPTISELFTRRLKAGVRPIGQGTVHPCDGVLTQAGPVESGQIVQTKGITYSVDELLKDANASQTFAEGFFCTYYLCPTDYHRVHSPVEGVVESVRHVPGQLWPVNPWSVENISQLFAINERVIFNIKTSFGPVALVMVGATNVGEISVSFDDSVRTNRPDRNQITVRDYSPAVAISKGQELGIFHMGSSVVVVYPKGHLVAAPQKGPVKMGGSL